MATKRYIVTLDDVRKKYPSPPSWIRITTITMLCKFMCDLDIEKIRAAFADGPIRIRRKGALTNGFEWSLKNTAFYNQVTVGYEDQYSNKSIKMFPNGSVQVAGCSDLRDCKRIMHQLSFLVEKILKKDIATTSTVNGFRGPVSGNTFELYVTDRFAETEPDVNWQVDGLNDVAGKMTVLDFKHEYGKFQDQPYNYRLTMNVDQEQELPEPGSSVDLSFFYKEPLKIENFRVVMINTNFSMNSTVDLMKVIDVLSEDEMFMISLTPMTMNGDLFDHNFIVSFNPERYSAVKVKFNPASNTKQVTASIFSTGKIIVTGAETLREIALAYEVLNEKLQSTKIEATKADTFDVIKGSKFDDIVSKLRQEGVKRF